MNKVIIMHLNFLEHMEQGFQKIKFDLNLVQMSADEHSQNNLLIKLFSLKPQLLKNIVMLIDQEYYFVANVHLSTLIEHFILVYWLISDKDHLIRYWLSSTVEDLKNIEALKREVTREKILKILKDENHKSIIEQMKKKRVVFKTEEDYLNRNNYGTLLPSIREMAKSAKVDGTLYKMYRYLCNFKHFNAQQVTFSSILPMDAELLKMNIIYSKKERYCISFWLVKSELQLIKFAQDTSYKGYFDSERLKEWKHNFEKIDKNNIDSLRELGLLKYKNAKNRWGLGVSGILQE